MGLWSVFLALITMLTASCALIATADIAIVKPTPSLLYYNLGCIPHSFIGAYHLYLLRCCALVWDLDPKNFYYTHFLRCLSTFDFSWVDLFKTVNSPAQQITCIVTNVSHLRMRLLRAHIIILQNYYVTLAGEGARARERSAPYFIRTLAPCVARTCASMRT